MANVWPMPLSLTEPDFPCPLLQKTAINQRENAQGEASDLKAIFEQVESPVRIKTPIAPIYVRSLFRVHPQIGYLLVIGQPAVNLSDLLVPDEP